MSSFRLGLPWPQIPKGGIATHPILTSVLGFCATVPRGQQTGLGFMNLIVEYFRPQANLLLTIFAKCFTPIVCHCIIHVEGLYNLEGLGRRRPVINKMKYERTTSDHSYSDSTTSSFAKQRYYWEVSRTDAPLSRHDTIDIRNMTLR